LMSFHKFANTATNNKSNGMDIFSIIWILWFLSEVGLNILLRSKMPDSQETDKNSIRIIWITIILSVTAGVFAAIKTNIPLVETNLLKYIGLILIIAGVVVRFTAIRTLGKFFTVNLAINNEHRLIDKGFYKYIRHPSYTGSLLSFLGLAVYFNNWICIPVILVPIITVFIFRINIEEKLLIQQPGLNYSEYIKRTKRLIPFVY
jgi:protein-S-isoprenylcysteine O-methyltransferase Ste14